MLYLDTNQYFTEVHLSALIQVLYPVVLTLILFFYSFLKIKYFKLANIIIYFYISYFILQQNIMAKIFDLLNCQNIIFNDLEENDNRNFLKNHLGMECSSSDYYDWIYFMVLPGLIIYSLIIPLSILIFSYIKRKEFKKKITIIKFDFMMRQPYFCNSSIWYSRIKL